MQYAKVIKSLDLQRDNIHVVSKCHVQIRYEGLINA